MPGHSYNDSYYGTITPGSIASAQKVIPVLMEYIRPGSVVDVGCGAGAWLKTWKESGVTKILGIDGYSGPSNLLIDPGCFMKANLEEPFSVQEKFDLVMSLEVAEHIRADHARTFISSLCSMGDLILFSAAIPGQGGVHHVNEQYPPYWIKIFKQNGFSVSDCIRPRIWDDTSIDTCYRQNMLFFVRDSARQKYPAFTGIANTAVSLVHPEHFQKKEEILQSYKKVLKTPFHAGWHFIKSFFRLFRSHKKSS